MKSWLVAIVLLLAAGGAYLIIDGSKAPEDPEDDGPVIKRTSEEEPIDIGPAPTKTDDKPKDTGRVENDPTRVEMTTPEGTHPQGIEGQVLSSSGGVVKDAEVYLLYGVSPTNMLQQLVSLSGVGGKLRARVAVNGKTDSSGKFRLEAPATESEASFELRVTAPKHVVHKHTLRIIPGRWEKLGMIQLQRGRTLTGTVRDATTRAVIAGAILRVKVTGFNMLVPTPGMEDGIETTTDDNGRYTLDSLPEGPMELTALAKDYGTFREQNLLFDKGAWAKTKDIELPKGYSISGWVTDADGNPISRARVEATPMTQATTTPGHAWSDKDGKFDLLGLGEGDYIVSARAVGFSKREEKPVKAGKREVHIALEKQGKIKVRVVARNGRPVKSYRVEVKTYFPQQGGNANYGRSSVEPLEVRGATNGEAMLGGVDPGTFVLQVTAVRFAKTYSESFTVPEGQVEPLTVQVTMNEGGVIVGIVTDETGKPLKGVSVYTLDDAYQDNPIFEIFKNLAPPKVTETTAVTNNRGEFRVEMLTPAKYQLRIDHPLFTRVYKKGIDVREGQRFDAGRVKLAAGGQVSGTVYVDGVPKGAAKVTISSSATSNGQGVFETTFTDEKGKFKFARMLPPGKYEVQATRTDYPNPLLAIADIAKSRKVVTVRRGMQTVTIQLTSK